MGKASRVFHVFVMGKDGQAVCLPGELIADHLGELNRTESEKGTYWHVKIRCDADRLHLTIPGTDDLDITEHRIT